MPAGRRSARSTQIYFQSSWLHFGRSGPSGVDIAGSVLEGGCRVKTGDSDGKRLPERPIACRPDQMSGMSIYSYDDTHIRRGVARGSLLRIEMPGMRICPERSRDGGGAVRCR